MGRCAIVAYTPKPDQDAALLAAVDERLESADSGRADTDKPASVMRVADGTIVEV